MLTDRIPTLYTAVALTSMMLLSAVSFASDDAFDRDLARSGYIHSPLRYTDGVSLGDEAAMKPVTDSLTLTGDWYAAGDMATVDTSGDMTVFGVVTDTGTRRATGPDSDPDYAVYGHARAVMRLGGISLSPYNRLCLVIEPRCPGQRVVNINLTFDNRHRAGEGYNEPAGAHLIHLRNNAVNRCWLDIADLRRDCVDNITLSVSVNGRDLPVGADSEYIIHSLTAQTVATPEMISGWVPNRNHIACSQTAYWADGDKTAVCSPELAGHDFNIIRTSDGRRVVSGRVRLDKTTIGELGVIDFSMLTAPGSYRIEVDSIVSGDFAIGDGSLWKRPCWRVLNFIFCQRCGYAVPGVHSRCHTDLFCSHRGRLYSFSGGWHDAGDLSQQTLQTAEVSMSLLELYDRYRHDDAVLAPRLREEALWGLDFVLRCRLGDGYHASSMGLLIWQDGIVGSHDDISSVRVQNLPFDNFLYAAVEAYAARILDDGTDPELIYCLRRVAAEDYDIARRRFAEVGFGGWISPYEHTYCTGESQFMATASWAASQLYALTGESRYADDAREDMDYVLSCRCEKAVGGLKGFFYRNPDHRSVVHFIHQSREQIFMQALEALCRTQASHPDSCRWRAAVADYGGYIRSLMKYTAPYGMIPSGIYRDDEYLDSAAFYAVHLFPPSDAPERFRAQAASGIGVAPGYFVRRFPVWFNIFNGNLAVHVSMGKAAAICAGLLDDAELRQIAREQLYWTAGKNPFCQSLIYGEGHRYSSFDNFSSGEIIGAMPVGIRSLGDSDIPYWPQINTACYKEVWLTSAGKWLSLLAEIK